ncbi:MAG: hypothetical protein PHD37_02935 [Gallionellaceae bacterium]|nr:hypothetical protein [Gallionellaceae bacterium]
MDHWTPGTFLLAIVVIIFAAAGLGTLLQRTFFKDEKPQDPVQLFLDWQGRKLRGTAGALVGVLAVILLVVLPGRLGIHTSLFGLTGEALVWLIILIFSILVPILFYLKRRK